MESAVSAGVDGLPEAYSALDRIEALALKESDAMITRQIQRIEQNQGEHKQQRARSPYGQLYEGRRWHQRLHDGVQHYQLELSE